MSGDVGSLGLQLIRHPLERNMDVALGWIVA
jgi:hypothetical protein